MELREMKNLDKKIGMTGVLFPLISYSFVF